MCKFLCSIGAIGLSWIAFFRFLDGEWKKAIIYILLATVLCKIITYTKENETEAKKETENEENNEV